MEQIYPEYYEKFHCIAGDCPDTCCKEWDVEVDAVSAEKYRALSGRLGDLLRENLYEEDGHTYLGFPGGKCPVQRADGLCGLQAAYGEGMLCEVCGRFPRISQDYGSFIELGLEMSCPEAARLILSEEPKLVRKEIPGGEPGDYDAQAMEVLRRTRPQMLAILADGSRSVPERLAMLLLYGYQVQNELDGGEEAELNWAESMTVARQAAGKADPGAVLDFFAELEILTDRWRALLRKPLKAPCWFAGLCRFASYGVLRYYEQAVSDYDLIGRVKLILTGCIVGALLAEDDFDSQCAVMQLWSKEIENDIDNVEAIEEGAYSHPALTDRNLLGILLG